METQNDVYFASATRSSSRCSMDSTFFYSAPTSPTRRLSSNALLGSQTEPTSPRTYEDSNSNIDDFEFETSRSFNHIATNMTSKQVFKIPGNHRSRQEKQHKERGDSLPTMAFADELFCDGKVMPLATPLKLPPSIRSSDNNRNGYRSYTAASSPRSPRSVLKLQLSRQCLWNDDFDPFTVALENVREEKRGKTQGNKDHRRARSMSPLRVTGQKKPNGSLDLINQMGPERPIQLLGFNHPSDQRKLTVSTRRTGPEVSQTPILLAEPKGLAIARHLEKMNHEKKPGKPDTTSVTGSKVEETSEVNKESGESKKRVSKRQRLKKFLLRSLSSSKVNDENKAKNENVGSRKPSFMRRFNSFRSEEQAPNCSGDERVSNAAKTALAHYRPRFSICLGYGTT